ncbi:hypothetical protein FRC08_011836 [Ceratobasidium sp. 394]|nr:hypothetical protein FRC08_011836 [Ceratobasidium sp. 394]
MQPAHPEEKLRSDKDSPIVAEYTLAEEHEGDGRDRGLKRQLKSRHVAMISIGGVLGTGLFLGTAGALQNGGPLGLLLGYSIVGTICYSVMISLGEMIAYLPISGGHIRLAERVVNPALSFAMGWFYWYMWVIVMPGELSASVVMINYWAKERINDSVWLVICIVVVVAINMCGAGVYGEAEFIFASIKVVTATGLIILGVVLDLGGGPNHDRIGFRYWKNPGPFIQIADIPGAKGRFLGWWSVMIQAAFSYLGTEIISITAGEAKNPRRSLPKAIRGVYIRILLFYICGTLVIGLLIPSNDPRLSLADGTAAASPFVIAIETAGIKTLPSIINAALVTSSWSGANCDLYTSSRSLYGLAMSGNAPKIFRRVNRNGLPWVSVIFCSLFSTLSFMSINAGAGRVFGWLANLASRYISVSNFANP